MCQSYQTYFFIHYCYLVIILHDYEAHSFYGLVCVLLLFFYCLNGGSSSALPFFSPACAIVAEKLSKSTKPLTPKTEYIGEVYRMCQKFGDRWVKYPEGWTLHWKPK